MRTIQEVADELGVDGRDLEPYGRYKGKIDLEALARPALGKGRLILVSALTPTAAGEGKTTVSIGLAMAMKRLGRRAVLCLREPSLGPIFGSKGGGAGGGLSRLFPAEDVNLHFTGDFHAIASAHNLLAALVDNELYFEGATRLDPRRIYLPRVLDVNDRFLRNVVIGLGGLTDGIARQARFDITAASEVMAAICLTESVEDLRTRLGRIVVGRSKDDRMVSAAEIGAVDAMLALLLDAIKPNLVQTVEGSPALVHGGPFANIAHGCSSVLATRIGLDHAEDVITEAGFGFDLGGEKFLDIKCRTANVWPRCVVLVATARGLAHHGGHVADPAAAPDRAGQDVESVERGLVHLMQQATNIRAFGLEPIVAINVFAGDSDKALRLIESYCRHAGLRAARVTAFADGGAGALRLAEEVSAVLEKTDADPPEPRYLYALAAPFIDKVRAIAKTLYGAAHVELSAAAQRDVQRFARAGYVSLPVCMAKTQLALSGDPKAGVFESDFKLQVSSVRLAAGAGFLVALAGDISTMPGLPHDPAARRIRVEGRTIHGLTDPR